ncbi:MAG TPA: glycoside hydrolase family 3 C-terminal domain-containing protein, partial [Bacteroidales bacterium]|nr:glycoside hydrolase family 3 C-terminal domain-containing protein [Bacteroidales bacterium]
WKFEGMVVSDYNGIDQLFNKHFVAKDEKDAAMIAFNTGVQYEFPVDNFYKHLPALLKEGKIHMADIDRAVEMVLALKFELGLFENPYVDAEKAIAVSKAPEHRDLALKSARESIVLLKNDGILPLKKGANKSIAVIGPCASDLYFGGYAGEPYSKTSLLEGIREKAGKETKVLFAQGCKLTENTSLSYFNWKYDDIVFASREENLKLIDEAVKVASQAEVVILAIGENEHLCREAWAKNHIGDNMTLDLFGEQNELAQAIIATGKPVIIYLTNGRPLTINNLIPQVPAIIEGWYMGQETGHAAADIIFGDVNPSGKLTITVPKSVGQLPMYYNHKPSAQFADYISQDVKPMFHFGYGLSYTEFKYGEPVLETEVIKTGETVNVAVEVTNTGSREGDEIVQMYVHDVVSSVTRPVKELKGFTRVSLKPGEKKIVTFEITPEKLAYHGVDMKFAVEPGEFEILTGSSSRDEDLKKAILKVKE